MGVILVPNPRSAVTASLFHFGILAFIPSSAFILVVLSSLCLLCERTTIK